MQILNLLEGNCQMKTSISRNKNNKLVRVLVVLFWLLIWQISSYNLSNKLLLVSPITVIITLISLMQTKLFYISIANTFIRIISGFLIGCLTGTLLSIISYKYIIIKELLRPLISVIKATPVASIIILTLVWIKTANLSVFIGFLMVLPPIYTNMLKGLDYTDAKMLEMTKVFKVSKYKQIKYIYIPSIKPYLIAAISVALGFCWKAGVAAEIIGLPSNTVGEALYKSKIYLNTPELFAWTLFVIITSMVFETVFISLIRRI